MSGRLNGVFAVGFVAFYSLGVVESRAETNPEMRAAALLFSQFETVAYTSMEIPSGFDAPNTDAAILRYPFMELLAGLTTLEPKAVNGVEASYGPILVGAKDFLKPEGLGPVSSRECYLGLLKGGQQPDLAADFRKAKSESIEGRQVWTWEMPPYEGHPQPTEFYFTQVAGSYFVMANNRQDFQTVVHELTSPGSLKTAQAAIRGWTTFSAHKYWAYLALRRSGVADRAASGLTNLPPSVVALAFFTDVDARESYFSGLQLGRDGEDCTTRSPRLRATSFSTQRTGRLASGNPFAHGKSGG